MLVPARGSQTTPNVVLLAVLGLDVRVPLRQDAEGGETEAGTANFRRAGCAERLRIGAAQQDLLVRSDPEAELRYRRAAEVRVVVIPQCRAELQPLGHRRDYFGVHRPHVAVHIKLRKAKADDRGGLRARHARVFGFLPTVLSAQRYGQAAHRPGSLDRVPP